MSSLAGTEVRHSLENSGEAVQAATSPRWFSSLYSGRSHKAVFWTPTPRSPSKAYVGQPWILSLRSKSLVAGVGLFAGYEVDQVSKLWSQYGIEMGAGSLSDLLSDLRESSPQRQLDENTAVGAVLLYPLAYLKNSIQKSDLGLDKLCGPHAYTHLSVSARDRLLAELD